MIWTALKRTGLGVHFQLFLTHFLYMYWYVFPPENCIVIARVVLDLRSCSAQHMCNILSRSFWNPWQSCISVSQRYSLENMIHAFLDLRPSHTLQPYKVVDYMVICTGNGLNPSDQQDLLKQWLMMKNLKIWTLKTANITAKYIIEENIRLGNSSWL